MMSPNARQALFLFRLVINGEAPKRGETRPKMSKAEKDELVNAGLIDQVKQGNTSYFHASEISWKWASENLGVEIAKAHDLAPVLQRLLKLLGDDLRRQGKSLADFVAPPPEVPSDVSTDQIRRLYLEITGGRVGEAVRLAQLKDRLLEGLGLDVDAGLMRMLQAGEVSLQPIANSPDITPADEAAAAYVGGNPRHLVYLVK
ncbi:MAG: hypothetical protein SFV51_00880 [Bryobacteraceae bacterium]|nr:hypothetical protein [Bryobacteraceae bacterium]